MNITLDADGAVRLWARRSVQSASLVIDGNGAYCEISLERAHLEALRDQLPDALRGLDRWDTETDACVKSEAAEERAADAVARAMDLAVKVEDAGDPVAAKALRDAAAEVSARASETGVAVRAFEDAALDADYATDRLDFAMSQAQAVLRRNESARS